MARRIAIAGAGIGGLASATLLARAGHAVQVFDRFAEPQPVGSGLVIQPVGQHVLDALGLLERAEARGNRVHRLVGRCALSGKRVLDASYDAPGDPRYGLAIHRAALFDLLLDAAQEAGAEIVTDHTVADFQPGRLCFAGRPDLDGLDLVIDASGARSPLSPIAARPLRYGALWATVDWPADTVLKRNELRQVYARASKMLGVLPLGRPEEGGTRRAAIFWSIRLDREEAWRTAGLAAWQEEARALWPDFAPFANQIETQGQMTLARYAHGTLARPCAPGIAFVGDAAHQASPQLGQGANMALLDAYALARAMQVAMGDPDIALRWYAQARRWHVRLYQAMSRGLTPLYQSDSRLLPWLRNRVLFPASMLPVSQRALTRVVGGDVIRPLGSLA